MSYNRTLNLDFVVCFQFKFIVKLDLSRPQITFPTTVSETVFATFVFLDPAQPAVDEYGAIGSWSTTSSWREEPGEPDVAEGSDDDDDV